MSDELEPLGPLALRALAAEQRRGDVDAAMQERLLTRVVASVAVGVAATAAASTAAASTAAAAGNAGAGAAAGTTAGATGAAAAGLTIKALPWIIAAFVAGGGAGAAIHAAVAPTPSIAPQPSIVVMAPTSVAPPVAPPTSDLPNLPSMPVGSLPSAASTAPVGPRPSASATAAPSGGSDVDLAAERALVDRARAALSRGQSRDALDALEAHAVRYPRGRLSEEREALAVDALARAGRMDDARARAARFRTSYPNSVFGAVVEAAVTPR